MRTYAEHLTAWEEMERLGYDGVGFNEHHTSPYGLMNSPNIMAAAAAQRTTKLKLLIYGNLLPLHDPLRLAEELAMLDCLSSGRIVSGFARGIPREHNVYQVPLRDSRALRGSVGDHPAGLDRRGLLLTSSRIRPCGCPSPEARRRSSGRAATTFPSRRACCRSAACARTSSASTRAVWPRTATGSRPII